MFDRVLLRGAQASLVWGYRTAAVLSSWSITKVKGQWVLKAVVRSVDRYQAKQKPLTFAAPRKGGFWCWPVEYVQVEATTLTAQLGAPEQ